MISDLRFAFRMIGSHRWFSAAVILTLALGIGVNTTVFTLVNAVLFKPVPVPGGERLVILDNVKTRDEHHRAGLSYPDFQDLGAEARAFAGLAAVMPRQVVMADQDVPPQRVGLAYVSADLFTMLQLPPVAGRGFVEADEEAAASRVMLISEGLWRGRYGGGADTIGRVVRVNGEPATIIGIMPPGVRFPNNEEAWLPLVPSPELQDRANRSLQVIGLLNPGTSIDLARGEVRTIAERLAAQYPETNRDYTARVQTFHEAFNGGPIRLIFLLMLGAVAFVLLIACANVANMMLSRAISRRREMSVRAAIGATRGQIVRQLLVESVLLSVLGGVLGLALSTLGVEAFDRASQDVGKPYWILFEMDYVAFAYFGAISVCSGLLFGLVPALRASRVDLNTALKDDTAGSGSHRGNRLAGALVVVQFALTMVLLGGAGAMMRSFFAAQATNAFVPEEHLLTAHLHLPEAPGERYAESEARARFVDTLLPRLRTLPGVTHASVATHLPGLGSADRAVEIEGRPNESREQAPKVGAVMATPDHLSTIGLPILVGRDIAAGDGESGREVAVVTRAFAERFFPGESAVGRRFRFLHEDRDGPWMEIVGVSADIVQDQRTRERMPVVHVPFRQEPWGWQSVLLRSSADPTTLAGLLRSAVQELDAELPLFDVKALPAALERSRWFLRVFGSLFLVFAIVGLLMASVGIYAVVAQTTARRTREIGIRMALGATGSGILRLVLRRGVAQLGVGMALGLAGAAGGIRLLAQAELLPGISPNDPWVFSAITVVLLTVGLLACWIPARRALRVAPTEALRTE